MLLGAAILFWGWQTGWWLAALPMVLVYEGSRWVRWRWDLTTKDFRQTSHLCTVLLVGVLIYLFVSERSLQLIFIFFQWLPIICFPLLAAQAYSTSNGIDVNALLLMQEKPQSVKQQATVLNLTYPYYAICLVSASAANVRDMTFYLGMLLLTTLAFWFLRSPRFSPALWICLVFITASLGIVGHAGMQQLQVSLKRSTYRLFSSFYHRSHIDPWQRTTAIGDIGSLKLSNRIVLRVKPASGELAPELLTEAVYDRYRSPRWIADSTDFTHVKPDSEGLSWQLKETESNAGNSTVNIAGYLGKKSELLNLPDGTVEVNRLLIDTMERNQYGTVKIKGEPGFISYLAKYKNDFSLGSPPTPADLQIPAAEQPAIAKIVSSLDLTERSPEEILRRVESFFQQEFNYSLELTQQGNNSTPLATFLLDNRSGHCEYFATATTLLLRAVGIPTRYTVGYSVHEFSRLENQYIVRERNAHAWTQVYVNGTWQALDTTPSSWIGIEERAKRNWQWFFDLLSFIKFKYFDILREIAEGGLARYWWWLILPLGLLLWRWLKSQDLNNRKRIDITRGKDKNSFIGEDSEIYLVEQALNELGFIRDRSETFQDWLNRLENKLPSADLLADLRSLVRLHYRYRFDPLGIEPHERAKLRSLGQTWLSKYRQVMSSQADS